MSDSTARTRVFARAAAVGMVGLAAFNVFFVARALGPAAQSSDFRWWYEAAEIGIHHGWDRIYDPGLQTQYMSSSIPFVNPPPLAWLVAPLGLLSLATGYAIFVVLLTACLLAAALLAAGEGSQSKVLALGSAVGFFPAMISIVFGQPVAIVLLAVVATWWFDRRGRPVATGLCLSLIVFKPHIVLLIPLVLLLTGRLRAFVTWAISTGALVAASVLTLGPHGVQAYAHLLAIEFEQQQSFTVGSGWLYWVVASTTVAVTALIAWRRRGQAFDLPVALAVTGSLLTSHHLNVYDLALFAAVLWFSFRGGLPVSAKFAAVAMWVVLNVAIVNPTVVIGAELALFAVLAMAELRAATDRSAARAHVPMSNSTL